MKKAYRVISLLIASLAVTASCTKDGDTQIINETESTVESAQAESTIENKPYVPDGYEYLEGVGSWLSAEEEYKSYPDEKIDILPRSTEICISDYQKRKAKVTKQVQNPQPASLCTLM